MLYAEMNMNPPHRIEKLLRRVRTCRWKRVRREPFVQAREAASTAAGDQWASTASTFCRPNVLITPEPVGEHGRAPHLAHFTSETGLISLKSKEKGSGMPRKMALLRGPTKSKARPSELHLKISCIRIMYIIYSCIMYIHVL